MRLLRFTFLVMLITMSVIITTLKTAAGGRNLCSSVSAVLKSNSSISN